MKKVLLLAFASLFIAGACSSTTAPGTSGVTTTTLEEINLDDVQFVSALASFDGCDNLLAYLQEQAIARVGPYGLEDGSWYGPVGIARTDTPMMAAEEMVAESGIAFEADAGSSMTEGVDYSGTNVQEVGIDEPDIIKTDGSRIMVISNNELHLIDVSGDTPELSDSILFEGHWPREILFSGDRVFVLASTDSFSDYEDGVALDEEIGIEPGFSGYWRSLSLSLIHI